LAAGGHTDEHTDELTFGRLLNSLRTQKGIDLRTVSDETRIAVGTLRLLEAEDYDQLPDPVFVKGFLKSYAEAIGTPAAPIIQKFITGRDYHLEKKRIEAGRGKSGASVWPWVALGVFILICILYASFRSSPDNENQSEATVPKAEVTTGPEETDQSQDVDAQKASMASEEKPGSYLLQINAVDETWLKVIVDRQDAKEYLLNPGDLLELKATSGFNLLIGNAAGVRLQLNHKAIAVDGGHGQVVTLKLPK
jgi:cytoskeletal protein RodZ